MIKIGICGSSGSGKGYVCKRFSTYGYKWIDTDRVYRDLATPKSQCVKELREYFGTGILNDDGSLNRGALSKTVFEGEDSKKRLSKLNEITHRHIKKVTESIILQSERNGYKGVLIDAPVLFESGFDKMCDVTVCVTAPRETKLKRIIDRDNISVEKAEARINSQLSDETLKQRCTYEIDNSVGADIESQILKIIAYIEDKNV